MAFLPDIISIIKKIEARIDAIERSNQVKKITIPVGGKFVVNKETSDPTPTNGQIYYNNTTGKFRKCSSGVWSDIP